MENTTRYSAARRQAERKFGFYKRLAVSVVIAAGLVLLNALATPGKTWAIWPVTALGIGLLFHAFKVYMGAPCDAWKQRMIENELKKLS